MRARLPTLLLLLAACGPPVEAKTPRPILQVGYLGRHGEPPHVPYHIDFGGVQVRDSLTESLRIANLGTDLLLVQPIDVDGNGFQVKSDGRPLRPGEQMRVDVKFAPPAAGHFHTTFPVLSSDTLTSAGEVDLDGDGYDCGALDPILALDFGWVDPAAGVKNLDVTVTTTFGSGLNPSGCVASYELEQAPGGPFTLVSLTPSSDQKEVELHAAGKLELSVDFKPTSFEPAKASIVLRYPGDNSIAAVIPLQGNTGTPLSDQVVEVVPTQPDLTVLAVVDSSPAMQGLDGWALEHVRAAALEEAGIRHVQVGITSTGVGPDPSCTDALMGGADGRLLPIPASIRIFPIPIREDLMEAATAVGACHGDPMGLQALVMALSPALLDTADDPLHPEPDDGNLGLLPDGSDLRVVLIAASEDHSPTQPGDFANFIRSLRNDRRVSVRAVLGGGVNCQTHGRRYDEFASGLGGEVEDLCQPSVHEPPQQAPPYVIELPKVVLGNVEVDVDGQVLMGGYSLEDRTDVPGLKQVEIDRYTTAPDGLLFPLPGSVIKVTYDSPGI